MTGTRLHTWPCIASHNLWAQHYGYNTIALRPQDKHVHKIAHSQKHSDCERCCRYGNDIKQSIMYEQCNVCVCWMWSPSNKVCVFSGVCVRVCVCVLTDLFRRLPSPRASCTSLTAMALGRSCLFANTKTTASRSSSSSSWTGQIHRKQHITNPLHKDTTTLTQLWTPTQLQHSTTK